jgi:hypothetical protein
MILCDGRFDAQLPQGPEHRGYVPGDERAQVERQSPADDLLAGEEFGGDAEAPESLHEVPLLRT